MTGLVTIEAIRVAARTIAGNHGIATAAIARALGLAATIVMPATAPGSQ